MSHRRRHLLRASFAESRRDSRRKFVIGRCTSFTSTKLLLPRLQECNFETWPAIKGSSEGSVLRKVGPVLTGELLVAVVWTPQGISHTRRCR